jgi:carboxymethylenebutenolidase
VAALVEGPRAARVERVTFPAADGTLVDAIHAVPEGGATTGVVLHPDVLGIRALFDDMCRRLATHGYAVCAPEPFAHAPNDVRAAGEHPAAAGVRMEYVPKLDDAVQLDDLVRAGALLTKNDGVERLCVLGFCMGGMQTLKAAATGEFARAVAFYGMIRLPEAWRSPTMREPLDTAADVCPTLAIFGDADPFTPAADIEALREAWKGRTDCEVVVYPGAEHGFVHAPERPSHRAEDAADAWRRTLEFLHP